jgi:hypothetical protein
MGYVEKLNKLTFTVGKLGWKLKLHKNFFLYWILMKSVEQLWSTGKTSIYDFTTLYYGLVWQIIRMALQLLHFSMD